MTIRTLKNLVASAALVALLPLVAIAQEAAEEPPAMVIDVPQATSADDLLEKVRAGFNVESREDVAREKRFVGARDDQQQMLADARGKEAREEARSQALEKTYQENEVTIQELEAALEQRMGNLGELFGVTRQMAGDTRGNVEASITTSQFGR
ncbi:MAG: energy transducer TonB, partial [bacterium]